jgi:hypothetical protein
VSGPGLTVGFEGDLQALLRMLRANGVRSFHDGEMRIEFAPIVTPEAAHVPSIPIEDEKCRCGHEMHAHSEQGFCLKGCEPDKCADAVK